MTRTSKLARALIREYMSTKMAKGNAADGIFSLKAMDPVFNSD
jgi:hypothetical protein